MAAISGGVGASNFGTGAASKLGFTQAGFGQSFVSGAISNVATQGIGMAVGAQRKFSWAGVAAAGVSNMVPDGIGWQGIGTGSVRATGVEALISAALPQKMTQKALSRELGLRR
jgi:hypothetical protein